MYTYCTGTWLNFITQECRYLALYKHMPLNYSDCSIYNQYPKLIYKTVSWGFLTPQHKLKVDNCNLFWGEILMKQFCNWMQLHLIFLIHVRLGTEVLRIPSSTRPGSELMTVHFMSLRCLRPGACTNHSAISDLIVILIIWKLAHSWALYTICVISLSTFVILWG